MPALPSFRPATDAEVAEAVLDACSDRVRLSIRGGLSKAAIGASTPGAAELDMRSFSGVRDYDPAELVLTVGAGTPLAEIETLVASEGQALAFEPFDHGPIFGQPSGASTIGGVVAAGSSGSQRVSRGGVRDHLLGYKAVSGLGESFTAGAKVVKNVTGYDLPKLAAGSWGRLFAMTEVTLKVLPAPRKSATRLLDGLGFPAAQRAMSAALASEAEVAAAAFLPPCDARRSLTMLRLQGFGPSVDARGAMLDRVLRAFGMSRSATDEEARGAWSEMRRLRTLDGARPLWRINVPPSRAPALVASLEGNWAADWAGGLIWLASDVDPRQIRRVAEEAQGHAMLVRASGAMRAQTSTFHPPSGGIAALEARVRSAFDPHGVFETGRFGQFAA